MCLLLTMISFVCLKRNSSKHVLMQKKGFLLSSVAKILHTGFMYSVALLLFNLLSEAHCGLLPVHHQES